MPRCRRRRRARRAGPLCLSSAAQARVAGPVVPARLARRFEIGQRRSGPPAAAGGTPAPGSGAPAPGGRGWLCSGGPLPPWSPGGAPGDQAAGHRWPEAPPAPTIIQGGRRGRSTYARRASGAAEPAALQGPAGRAPEGLALAMLRGCASPADLGPAGPCGSIRAQQRARARTSGPGCAAPGLLACRCAPTHRRGAGAVCDSAPASLSGRSSGQAVARPDAPPRAGVPRGAARGRGPRAGALVLRACRRRCLDDLGASPPCLLVAIAAMGWIE